MTTLRPIAAVLLCGSALVTAPPAAAQFYAGGGLGWSDYKAGNASNDISSGTVDGEDTGFKLFGGYQFNRNFGFELAYLDLGKASYTGDLGGAPVTGGSLENTGFNFSVVGTLPLTQNFDLFGKLGAYLWETKARDVTGGVARIPQGRWHRRLPGSGCCLQLHAAARSAWGVGEAQGPR